MNPNFTVISPYFFFLFFFHQAPKYIKQRVETATELARYSRENTPSKANQDWHRHHPDGRYLSQ